jgi:hypothetical protein
VARSAPPSFRDRLGELLADLLRQAVDTVDFAEARDDQ